MKFKEMEESEKTAIKSSNSDLEADHKTKLLGAPEGELVKKETGFWRKGVDFFHEILEELRAPPTVGAVSSIYRLALKNIYKNEVKK